MYFASAKHPAFQRSYLRQYLVEDMLRDRPCVDAQWFRFALVAGLTAEVREAQETARKAQAEAVAARLHAQAVRTRTREVHQRSAELHAAAAAFFELHADHERRAGHEEAALRAEDNARQEREAEKRETQKAKARRLRDP